MKKEVKQKKLENRFEMSMISEYQSNNFQIEKYEKKDFEENIHIYFDQYAKKNWQNY